MKALLPIDGSDASDMTLEWATGFLSPATKVYLLHVIDPRLGTVDKEWIRKLLDNARSIFRKKGFPEVYIEDVIGAPGAAICEYANNRQIPLIIIGAQGKSGIGKFLMGSVSSDVFKNARQQVLVLNNKPRPSLTMNIDEALSSGQAGKEI